MENPTPPPPIRLDQFDNADFNRGAPAWKEALWQITRAVFFLPGIPWPSALRVGLLRVFGARVGTSVVIRSGANIHFPWRLQIGNHTWVGEGVTLLTLADIVIGDHVCLSQQAFLCTGSHNMHRPSFDLLVRPIHISSHSWIGARAFIGPGVSVGEGSFVTATTVVSKDIPPWHTISPSPPNLRPRRSK